MQQWRNVPFFGGQGASPGSSTAFSSPPAALVDKPRGAVQFWKGLPAASPPACPRAESQGHPRQEAGMEGTSLHLFVIPLSSPLSMQGFEPLSPLLNRLNAASPCTFALLLSIVLMLLLLLFPFSFWWLRVGETGKQMMEEFAKSYLQFIWKHILNPTFKITG